MGDKVSNRPAPADAPVSQLAAHAVYDVDVLNQDLPQRFRRNLNHWQVGSGQD